MYVFSMNTCNGLKSHYTLPSFNHIVEDGNMKIMSEKENVQVTRMV